MESSIKKELDNTLFHEAKIKRSAKVKNIASLYNTVKINNKKSINIKPTTLFLRLIAIAQRESDLEKFFNYELTSALMSLFKDGLMRKPNKSILHNALLTIKVDVHPTALHVLDGGALLHKVRWNANSTFEELCLQYVNHVKKNHGVGKVVFDGYSDKPSTKDHEHTRRTLTRKGSAGPRHNSVLFNAATKVLMKQDKFLLSGENKSRFIDMLSGYLTRAGNDVVQCKNDADTEIVKCALDVAKTGRRVNVVADDTDVALLLLCHWEEEMADVSFTSERSKATFDIKSSLSSHHPFIKPFLLFCMLGQDVIQPLLFTWKGRIPFWRGYLHQNNWETWWGY